MASRALDHAPCGVQAPFAETSADAGAYEAVLGQLQAGDLAALCADIERELERDGVSFGSAEGPRPFVVDPVPRILPASEWEALATGLVQRVRALERFVADIYDQREIVHAGVVPWSAVQGASYHEPALSGLAVGTWIPVAGLDVVRNASGTFCVLEDNLRTPSGLAYALAARKVVAARVRVPQGRRLAPLDEAVGLLGRAIAALAPAGITEPSCVMLSDGTRNPAFYEHQTLANLLGLPLVTSGQLEQAGGRLCVRLDGRRLPVDVVYRRTDADRLFSPEGRPEPLAELLLEPWRRGRLGVANAFGAGVADDKLIHAYVEDMIQFYLREEPLLSSVRTWDLCNPDVCEVVLARLDELVVKPRDGHGGQGVVIGPLASGRELRLLAAAVAAHPERYVAQDTVMLSDHPTACGARLERRHVDLRPFVLMIGEQIEVVPGGLTRVALDAGSLVVNSSRRGGAKDTWILS